MNAPDPAHARDAAIGGSARCAGARLRQVLPPPVQPIRGAPGIELTPFPCVDI